jgi:hypothetical protein
MLVRITQKCRMGCNHCMVEASEFGEHMTLEVFCKVLAFVKRYPFEQLLISGGEPLENPEFFEMMELAKGLSFPQIIILSNGMFVEEKDVLERVIKLGLMFQITNDPRYYPSRIEKIDHPLFVYVDSLQMLTKLGRAKKNEGLLASDIRFSPMCFNLRSIARQSHDFSAVLLYLRTYEKFCTPSINVDGTIVAGEAPTCFKIGDVNSDDKELVQNLLHVDCNQCGLEDNLPLTHKLAIGLPTDKASVIDVSDVWK